MTNAHVIQAAVNVRVRREGFAEKFEAEVVAACPEMDLAVLTVADEGFWADEEVAVLASGLPRVGSSTTVVGSPTGGESRRGMPRRASRAALMPRRASRGSSDVSAGVERQL